MDYTIHNEESAMDSEDVVLRVLDAVEHRRLDELRDLYHPEVEFHWQTGLPYGGDFAGPSMATMGERFATIWGPLQPDADTRRMDPVVVATNGGDVVVNYTWRGRDARGRRFETPTLAHYRVADGRLRDARMFYYDLVGLIRFLDDAR